jgi:protein-disulfide isomerase
MSTDSKVVDSAAPKRRPPNAGKGRKKGVPNKTTAAVKDMILQALSNKGGAKYLEKQADQNPAAFMQLVGKVLPLDVNAKVTTTPAYTVDDWLIPASPDSIGRHAVN